MSLKAFACLTISILVCALWGSLATGKSTPPPSGGTGACCINADDSCEITTDANCTTNLGGVYEGDDTTCADCPFLPAGEIALMLDPQSGCQTGDFIVLKVSMENVVGTVVTSYQCFIEYDTNALNFEPAMSTYGDQGGVDDPFEDHIIPIAFADLHPLFPDEIVLDGNVPGLDADLGTSADTPLAYLVFSVRQQCGSHDFKLLQHPLVQQFSELSFEGMPIFTDLTNTGIFTIDSVDPTITCPAPLPDDTIVECDKDDPNNEQPINTGSPIVGDNCGTPTPTFNDVPVAGTQCEVDQIVGTITRTWTTTDACGNTDTCDQTIVVMDTTDPTFDLDLFPLSGTGELPSFDIDNLPLGTCSSDADPPIPGVDDNCAVDQDIVITCTRPAGDCNDPYVADPADFPGYTTTTITWKATDLCGNYREVTQDVRVLAANEVPVALMLECVETEVSRCIHFESMVCNGGGAAAIVTPLTDITLDFTDNGCTWYSTDPGQPIKLPCGDYDTLCIKDEQHTMYAVVDVGNGVESLGCPDIITLRAGDTDNDSDVDTNDVSQYVMQFGFDPVFGSCPWNGMRDADFNGDGAVDTNDYVCLAVNFLSFVPCVCPPPTAGDPDHKFVLEIGSTDIPAGTMNSLDHNADGVFNWRDVEIFERINRLPDSVSRKMRAASGVPPRANPPRNRGVGGPGKGAAD